MVFVCRHIIDKLFNDKQPPDDVFKICRLYFKKKFTKNYFINNHNYCSPIFAMDCGTRSLYSLYFIIPNQSEIYRIKIKVNEF